MSQNTPTNLTFSAVSGVDNPIEFGRAPFWRLRYCENLSFLRHVPQLFWLTDICRPNFVVELGVEHAQCYFALCQAMDRLNPNGACRGIFREDIPKDIRSHNAQYYKEISTISTGAFRDSLLECADCEIDILVVNAEIELDELQSLSQLWGRKLSDKGVVVLRNYRRLEARHERRLLDELATGCSYLRFDFDEDDDEGMSVIIYGSHQADSLQKLTSIGFENPEWNAVRNIFERIGESAYYRGKAQKLKTALSKQRNAAALAPSERELETIRAAYRARSEKLGSLRMELLATNDKLRETGEELLSEQNRLNALRANVERDTQRHKHEVAILTRKLESGGGEAYADLRRALDKSQEDIDRLNVLLELKRMFIAEIHSRFSRIFQRRSRSRDNIKAMRIVASSPYFDGDWYLREYPDVRASGQNPASHFVLHGVYEGRRPSEGFDPIVYYIDHPDALKAGLNPLVHVAGIRSSRD